MRRFFSPIILAMLGLFLTSLFWAGNIFVSKLLIGVIPPFTLNFLRWMIAVIVLLPFIWSNIHALSGMNKQAWLSLSVYGFLGVTIYNAFLYTAAYTTSGLNIAVISTITPLLTFVFAWLFLGDRPSRNQMIGFVFGITGVLVLLSSGNVVSLLRLAFSHGDIWMLLACLGWAIYTVFLVKKPSQLTPIIFMFITTTLGLLMALPMVVWELTQIELQLEFSQTVVISLVYVGIFPSVCSYLLFNYGVSVLGSQTASLCAYLIPVFTAIIGILFLQEGIHLYHLVSQFLVLLGFCLTLNKGHFKRKIMN